MADDPERDIYPTKEGQFQPLSMDVNVSEKHASPEKRFASPHLSRTDLEDQFYRFKEENFQLKKATNQQEANLKRLATKMTRLLREKKSMEVTYSPGHKRDLELEEMVEDLQDKVRQLEKTNTQLREKALVARQQVILQTRRPNPYSHIPPKVNSGNNRSVGTPYLSSISLRGKSLQNISRKPGGGTPIPPYALSLLEEARSELSNLKMLVINQKNEVDMYQQENDMLKQNMRMREIEFDEEMNILKSQLTQRQRQHVQENLDLIRLHREVKQKNSKILGMQAQHSEMEEKMRMLKLNHDHLVKDMDELSLRFKNEQKKNLELLGEIQKAEITFSASSEFQDRIKSLMKENDVLRETNDKLLKSALGFEKEKSYNQLEQVFKERISNLETSLEIQMKTKASLEEQLIREKGDAISKDETCNMLKVQMAQLKSHIEELEIKLNFLKSENVDFDELKEAIDLLKLYRAGKLEGKTAENGDREEYNSITKDTISDNKASDEINEGRLSPIFVEKEELSKLSEELEDLKAKLNESEEDHSGTLQELNNVREMLMAQCKLNDAAQDQTKLLAEKVEEQRKVYESQLEEYAHLLDIRSTRIQKLEKQLNDIAFGTTTFNITESTSAGENPKPVKLSRGENIFEIHIVKLEFTQEGLKALNSPNSKVFLTWNFYEFELQSTPVIPANKSFFNFSAQYTVQVDDYFLYYLHENLVTLELHESVGVDFKTVADCQLSFSNIFSKSKGHVYGTQKLTGLHKGKEIEVGTVEFWIRFKVPMEDTFKLFKEKIKALKYIHSNKGTSTIAVDILKQPSDKNVHTNELHVKILRGINIKSRQKDKQPNTYCIYKFYDLPDQDTCIVPASNNPEFSDHHIFPLFIDAALEKYLATEVLHVYVFDDDEPDISSPIGKATICLQPLIENSPIKGNFELVKDGKNGLGSIEALIYWQYDYTPVSEMPVIPKEQMTQLSSPEVSSALSSSDEEMTAVPFQEPPVPKPRTRLPSKKMTSTPKVSDSSSSSEEDHTYMLSPKLSPVKSDQMQADIPKPARRSIRTTGNGKDMFLPSPDIADYACGQEDEWSDVMSNKERKASYEETSDQEEKDDFDDGLDDTESDSDDIPKVGKESNEQVPLIIIQVSHLEFKDDSSVLQDPLIKLLYVEYRFLDYPLEELETPFSLPKKGPPDKIEFNFEKEFQLKLKDSEKWNLLAKMFTSDSPESSLIQFTVVSEPASDDQNLECEDVGYGSIDLREIFENDEDIIDKDIPILDARDTTTVIGSLNISIQALDALRLLQTFVN